MPATRRYVRREIAEHAAGSGGHGSEVLTDVLAVADYGAVGDGATDDTAAIQAAIDDSQPGDTIYLPDSYLVSATIRLLKSRRYLGSHREKSVIKQAAGANLDAVMASETWLSTSSVESDNLIVVERLTVDGNKANQSSGLGHGLALVTFWSDCRDMIFYNTRGDGILLSSARRDGTEITNTAVENHFQRIDVRNAGGYGIRVTDPSSATQTVTDGFIRDCLIQDPVLDGIRVESSAGWLIDGNHIYGTPRTGINMGRADSTRVIGNYIESFGDSGTAGSYAAIALGDGTMFIGSSNPSIVAGNTAFYTGGANGSSFIRGILIATSNSVTSHLTIVGNGLYGTGTSDGIRLTNQGSGSVTNAVVSGNLVRGWSTRFSVNAASGTINVAGDTFRTGIATTAVDGFARLPTVAGTPSGTPTSSAEGAPMVYDTSANKLWVYNGAAWVGVTLS